MTRDRGGFTLIELLIGLVLGGILTATLFQLIMGQGRFFQRQSALEEVQQNSRAALELIGSELRTLPEGGALVRAAADSITIRTPRIWGSVCSVTSATTLDIAFPSIPGASFTPNTGTGLVVNLGSTAAPVWSGAVAVTSIGGASGNCSGAPLPPGVESRTFALAATPQNGSATPAVGDVVYVYDQVTYRTGTSSLVPGLWIQRRVGTGSNQPMAGPIVEEGTGLRFTYFANGSTTPLSTPIIDAGTRESVTKVMIEVGAISRNGQGDLRGTRTDTVVVSLRNRGM